MSTLGAAKISKLALDVPTYGAWRADVILESGDPPAAGPTTLTAGDLALVGSVLPRVGNDAPSKPHAVVVGGPGWERPIATPPSYQADAGVRLSSILKDLAKRSGEPIEQPADATLGTSYAFIASRSAEPLRLRDALNALAKAGHVAPWRVDPDGVTRFGLRTGTAVTARATEMRRNAGVGLVIKGLDSPRAFLPGNTIDGQTIRRLVVNETAGSLSAELYVDAPSPMTSILRKVAEVFPQLVYGHPRTYKVFAVRNDGRLDLAPPPDAPHLPELPAVEQWTLGGAIVTPQIGADVVVIFRDANPSRPVVIGFAPGTPVKVAIDADAIWLGDAFARIPREGDTYTIGAATGPLTFVSTTDPNGPTKVKA